MVLFLKSEKSNGITSQEVVTELKGVGYEVKYLRWDNAGENERPLRDYCKEKGVILDLTAPVTPQMNGVTERKIAVLMGRGNSQMYASSGIMDPVPGSIDDSTRSRSET